MKLFFKHLLTHTGWKKNCILFVESGKITNIVPNANIAGIPPSDKYHMGIPGFIDVQVNGGGGVLFNQNTSVDGLGRICKAHLAHGTTAMLPTLITDSTDVMRHAAKAIVEARRSGFSPIVGIHFEGPWLSQPKKGVHKASYIRPPTSEDLSILRMPGLGKVMVTVAPETVSTTVISELVNDGIIVFLGHSNATAEQVSAAISAGATGFTHLYNAMSPLQGREPGMVGVALANKHTYAGLIVDGHHVSATACRVAINAKGAHHVALVTDAMALAASNETSMAFFDDIITKQKATVLQENSTITEHGDMLTIGDGTLAGSCLTMIDAVNNVQNMCDVSLDDASIMASLTPASILGLADKLGSLAVGKKADLIALSEQNTITSVWQSGTLFTS